MRMAITRKHRNLTKKEKELRAALRTEDRIRSRIVLGSRLTEADLKYVRETGFMKDKIEG